MTFKTELANDAKNNFLNNNEFSENISYTPAGGSAKTIKAVVTRQRLNAEEQSRGRLLANEAEIFIANDATDGVSSVDYQGATADTVSMPMQPGGSNVTWRVVAIISKDDGMWHLRLKR